MTEADIVKIIAMLRMYYPVSFKGYSKDEAKTMIILWLKKFNKYTYKELYIAIERLSSRMKYCPSVAEILEELEIMRCPMLQMKAEDEWEKVREVLFRYGSYKQKEGMDTLLEPTRSIVRQLGYDNLCRSENNEWNRKTFIEMFNDKIQCSKEILVTNEKALTVTEIIDLAKINGSNKQLEANDGKDD